MGAVLPPAWLRTARALYRGPLTGTAQALTDGELSAAHAQVLAAGTHDLPAHLAADAEPVLLEAARRLDPPRLRRAIAHLRLVADPDGADDQAERRQQQRGLWLASTGEGMVAVNGLLDPEAGQTVLAALEPLDPEACRRLACDGAVTRVLVTRQPLVTAVMVGTTATTTAAAAGMGPGGPAADGGGDVSPGPGRCARPAVGGRAHQPGRVGRPTAPVVRDGGCVVPGCDRPPAWCEAHHLRHWLHGGPTDLENLAPLCRAHHRAVHEGGWRLRRHPTPSKTPCRGVNRLLV